MTTSAAWRALQEQAAAEAGLRLDERFAQDTGRAARYSLAAVGLFLDYSKQRISAPVLAKLLDLARQQALAGWIARLFAGEAINHTEQRAAGHVALRAPRDAVLNIGGENVVPAVHAVLDRMIALAETLRCGARRGFTGEAISDVVNIGIGGSDFGPRMVWDALSGAAPALRAHFVANVDGAQLSATLPGLDPARTLFIVTSKTFTTQETMANARAARRWLTAALGDAAVERHFVAVSTSRKEVTAFGIAPEHMFEFWDWVGGRYSLWSAVGLANIIALGPETIRALLDGAHAMDEHFRSAPPAANMPVLLGLLAVWNNNFLGAASHVVAPYAQRLRRFVGWLQQLEMESNGKGVDREGRAVDYATTPPLWGDVGTNAQHAFFQMLHQGPALNPVDFILPVAPMHALPEQQPLLIANCLAQSAALMRGKTGNEVRAELAAKGLAGATLEAAIPPRVFSGDRPSNTILMPRLDAFHLGALCALYEHRTFVMSVLWNLNAFDQWGVELGKQLAQQVLAAGEGHAAADLDGSTRQLLERVRDAAR
ncbi:MAG: glucose-6-phosphate isomerase [Nevskia sp.]